MGVRALCWWWGLLGLLKIVMTRRAHSFNTKARDLKNQIWVGFMNRVWIYNTIFEYINYEFSLPFTYVYTSIHIILSQLLEDYDCSRKIQHTYRRRDFYITCFEILAFFFNWYFRIFEERRGHVFKSRDTKK